MMPKTSLVPILLFLAVVALLVFRESIFPAGADARTPGVQDAIGATPTPQAPDQDPGPAPGQDAEPKPAPGTTSGSIVDAVVGAESLEDLPWYAGEDVSDEEALLAFYAEIMEDYDDEVSENVLALVLHDDAVQEDVVAFAAEQGLVFIGTATEGICLFFSEQVLDTHALSRLGETLEDAHVHIEDSGLLVGDHDADDDGQIDAQLRPTLLLDEIILELSDEVDEDWLTEALASLDLVTEYESFQGTHDGRYLVVATTPASPGSALQVAALLKTLPFVTDARPNVSLHLEMHAPDFDDPFLGDQWHLQNTGQPAPGCDPGAVDADIDAPQAWDLIDWGALGKGPIVAIVDMGFDVNHPDLAPNLWTGDPPGDADQDGDPDDNGNGFVDDVHGWDFPSGDADLAGDPHGTGVAGCLGARGDNGVGVSGVCPRCRMMFLQVREKHMKVGDLEETFRYAVENGAGVISCSIAIPVIHTATDRLQGFVEDALTKGRDGKGCVILFAMENNDTSQCLGPGPQAFVELDGVLSVSAATNQDNKEQKSGHGPCLDVLGPTRRNMVIAKQGTINVVTTDPTDGTGYLDDPPPDLYCQSPDDLGAGYTRCFGGTSAATPIVGGIAALLLAADPDLRGYEVARLIRDTADKIEPARAGYDPHTGLSLSPGNGENTHGYGRVNAFEAVRVVADAGRGGVDLMVRDHALDWGNTEQPTLLRFDPITRSAIAPWTSPDVKLDAAPFHAAPADSKAFDAMEDEAWVSGSEHRVHVRPRNRGPKASGATRVAVLWTAAGADLPDLPADPFAAAPGVAWQPLAPVSGNGPGLVLPTVDYCGPSVAHTADDTAPVCSFVLPAGVDAGELGPALVVVMDGPDDGLSPPRETLELVTTDNNAALRSLHRMAAPAAGQRRAFDVTLRDPGGPVHLRVEAGAGWDLTVDGQAPGQTLTVPTGSSRTLTLSVGGPDDLGSASAAMVVWLVEGSDTTTPLLDATILGGFTLAFTGQG